ncbi:cytochrome P450 2D14-like isoform X2 [Hemicordylus capensis]|nr:cytochrome P450 2D14-like isoform X2 [Hemicordylus capensis]XP_053109088.1 cytochrome P450 2D14-like isoform X2 [Hemicordylus capensis]XP_053109089.1 cytochrome P450 2D14-like isoform X2 [Hemicordylus capensis]XP_053109090.1 cytochrome P450 2D14-like isoform X2 [Hemicordylus capensis]
MIGHKRNAAGLLLANYSNNWKQQRKFCMSVLKHFGMGKKTLEKRIREEAGYLCSELRSKRGSPFNPEYIMFNAVTNIICILTFGDRFEYNDEKFLKLIHLAENLMKAMARVIPQVFSAGSWLAYIPGPHHNVLRLFKDFCGMLSEIVSEHKKTRDPTLARDVIDEYLEEIEKDKGNPETSFNEQNLINVICDLFLAGAETTSNTLLWGLFYMVLHPEIQQKVQEEIDNVIGRARPPMMEDQQKLPYTNAVIHEIQRAADIAPIALPRATYRDTEVDNFYIPKGTVILTMLTTVLKDETMWEKPHQFYPEHFLDANGQFVKHEAFLPFSLGLHVCAGEQLAKMELFIFFISLLQHFTLCIPENSPTPKEDRVFALTIPAPTLQICAIPR